ncbi:MAG: septum formation initiator family protein [Alphaproteobacteria bacterium]|nr:septum formation initiator family protein [Alphaproteobacteria bacterium]
MSRISFFKVIPLVSVLITTYFFYHGIYGNRGFLRLEQIHQEYANEQKIAQNISAEKNMLQKKVKALQNGAPDLVQEEALRVLNMAEEDNLIVLESK